LDDDESLSKAEAERIFKLAQTQGAAFEKELRAWLTLHETAELSVIHGTAIYFASTSH
jgi:hypothetical protein